MTTRLKNPNLEILHRTPYGGNPDYANQMNLIPYIEGTYASPKAPDFMSPVSAHLSSKRFLKTTHHFQTLFMQNEPNFNNAQNTLNILPTKHLHQDFAPPPIKKTNPNEPNFKIGKIAPNILLDKDLSLKMWDLALKKTNPIFKIDKTQANSLQINALHQKLQISPTNNEANYELEAKRRSLRECFLGTTNRGPIFLSPLHSAFCFLYSTTHLLIHSSTHLPLCISDRLDFSAGFAEKKCPSASGNAMIAQMTAKSRKDGSRTGSVTVNKKAYRNFELVEKFEAGLKLKGSEVKSLRCGQADLTGSYARVSGDQCWLVGASIAQYQQAGVMNHEPTRKRRLLLHKSEIRKITTKLEQRGFTLVPLRIYFNDRGLAKIELALARGKRQYDKRAAMAEREQKKDVNRSMKKYRR